MKKWFIVMIGGMIISMNAQTKLYVGSNDAQHWIEANRARTADVRLMKKIADAPQAIWINGSDLSHVEKVVVDAGSMDQLPVFVLYEIPGRDNGNYSRGGLSGPSAYTEHVQKVAAVLNKVPSIIVIEPDALGLAKGLKDPQKNRERYEMIADAVSILHSQSRCKIFPDISMWLGVEEAANALKRIGIDKADGFCLNTSGYETTEKAIEFGNKLNALVGKPFVIDTSRNGNGPFKSQDKAEQKDPWCNPPGRALGLKPTLESGMPNVFGFLWIKRPGESDGECRGGPAAGVFWPERALELARNAKW